MTPALTLRRDWILQDDPSLGPINDILIARKTARIEGKVYVSGHVRAKR